MPDIARTLRFSTTPNKAAFRGECGALLRGKRTLTFLLYFKRHFFSPPSAPTPLPLSRGRWSSGMNAGDTVRFCTLAVSL